MKALWIVNKRCGGLHKKLHGKKATGGQWLDAMLEEAVQFPEDRIVVVNIEKKPALFCYEDGQVTYYTLPGESNACYNYKNPKTVSIWKEIMDKEKPDVMVIWGTEFPYSLAAMKAAPHMPSVIYIQGILDSIGKYYLSGLTQQELKTAKTFRDVLTGTTIYKTQKDFAQRAAYEREIIRKSGHVIIENQWAAAYLRKLYPNVQEHYLPISISKSFCNYSWDAKSMEKHTVMCPAADYPIKGLHMLIKAMAIVKEFYPDVKLYIPGTPLTPINSLRARLKETGYARLIKNLIQEYGLQKNLIYTGRLTADEMAQRMAKSNCFVMTSAIENHSSTLKEAMMVGTPCVASFVGGVSQYAADGKNCLLYRYEDYEVLAQNIIRLFEDDNLAQKLSVAANAAMQRPNNQTDYEKMKEILVKATGSVE